MRSRYIQFSFFARRFYPIDVAFPLFSFDSDWPYLLYSIFFPFSRLFFSPPSFPVAPFRRRRIHRGNNNYLFIVDARSKNGRRVILIILSRDQQPRPLSLSPPLPSPSEFVLYDIGHDEMRDVTDVSLISLYWLGCRDAYINFSVHNVERTRSIKLSK